MSSTMSRRGQMEYYPKEKENVESEVVDSESLSLRESSSPDELIEESELLEDGEEDLLFFLLSLLRLDSLDLARPCFLALSFLLNIFPRLFESGS